MITDDAAEKAVEWLTQNATKAAQARANREYITAYLKTVKAQVMAQYAELPLAAQEREALRDSTYIEQLNALRIAVEEDERFRWLQAAAEARIDAWRTMASNQRALGKL